MLDTVDEDRVVVGVFQFHTPTAIGINKKWHVASAR
jgi:hypothetical protein